MNSSYPRNAANDVNAYTITTGAVIKSEDEVGCTLAAGTYFFPIPEARELLASVHGKWNSTLAAVLTFENSNFPEYDSALRSSDDVDVSIIDTTAGNWVKQDPTTAYVAIAAPGADATVANMTVTIAGGTANGMFMDLGNTGARRGRIRAVVTVAGTLRIAPWGKGA